MTADDYLLVGQSFVRSQKVDLAIKEWRKALQLEPNHFESRIALEQTLLPLRLDRLAEAEKEAELLLAQARQREALRRALARPDSHPAI